MFWTNAVTGVKFPACTCVSQQPPLSPLYPLVAQVRPDCRSGKALSIWEEVLACCSPILAHAVFRTHPDIDSVACEISNGEGLV